MHPEMSISKQQTDQSGEPIWHAFTQFVKKTSVPDSVICCCYISPERQWQSLLFRFCWNPFSIKVVTGESSNMVIRASTFPGISLVWTEQTFNCGRNALECKTLQELVTHSAVRLGGS